MKYNIGDVIITVSDTKDLWEKLRNKIGVIIECNNVGNRGATYKIMLCGMKEELRYTNNSIWMAEDLIKEALYKSEL
jgi:hypothetical protein